MEAVDAAGIVALDQNGTCGTSVGAALADATSVELESVAGVLDVHSDCAPGATAAVPVGATAVDELDGSVMVASVLGPVLSGATLLDRVAVLNVLIELDAVCGWAATPRPVDDDKVLENVGMYDAELLADEDDSVTQMVVVEVESGARVLTLEVVAGVVGTVTGAALTVST